MDSAMCDNIAEYQGSVCGVVGCGAVGQGRVWFTFYQQERGNGQTMTEMYKITSMDSGAWCSLTCNVVSPEFVLTYALDQWTTPKAGRILVFDTLENAIDFLWENGWITEKVDTRDDIAIWQCEAVNPVKVNSLLRNVDSAKDVEGLSRFWSGEPDFFIRLTEVPKGTYGAERVRLTKKVWPDD